MATPQSSFRSFVGMAKVSLDGILGAAVGASATSITPAGGTSGITTADSIIFLDGANTEVCTVTSAPSGGNVPISATAFPHLANSYFFVQATASLGPSTFLPVTNIDPPDMYEQLYDESYRGVPADKAGVAQGIRTAEWTVDGNAFGDTIGYLLGAILGSEDFTAGTPNSHLFALNCQGNGQPDKYAWYFFDDINCRVVVGRLSELTMKYDPKALIAYTGKLLARASGVVATPTPSYSTLPPLPSWRTSVQFAGTYAPTPKTIDLTLTRGESENIPTLSGTQDPLDSFVGPLGVSIKSTLVKVDDTMLSRYLSGTLFSTVLSFTQGSGAGEIQLVFQATECNIDTEGTKPNRNYITEDIAVSTIFNATDANVSGGGESPCRFTLVNAIAGGVYV